MNLNPVNWIKNLLISDYVGSALRHGLTGLGAYMISYGLDPVLVNPWVSSTTDLVVGSMAIITALIASVKNKTTP